jgi:uncharacterized membrane protein
MKKIILLFSVGVVSVYSCTYKKGDVVPSVEKCDSVSYVSEIRSITTTYCQPIHGSGCHEAGSAVGDYSTYSGLKAKVDNGSLYNRVVDSRTMPPAGLTDDNVKKINCWLKQGALNN